MKICVISPGVVHAVPRTIAIADHFDEVHFIDWAGKQNREILESHGVVYHCAGEEGGRFINKTRLLSILRVIEPDAIVCHYASGDHFFNAIAYGRCPVAVVAMGNDILYDEGDTFVPFFTRFLIRTSLRRADYISAKSEFLVERIRRFGAKAQIDVNYWGADLDRCRPGSRAVARRELSLDENKTVILSPRAIEPRLNIHLIVEAFASVVAKHPDALLVILGRSNPDYKNRIVSMVKQLSLVGRIRFLDEVPPDILSLYIQASDVVVSVAHSEGFPNTLLEVMACKVPMVVGRIAQIQELLQHDSNAWICEKDSPAIAAAILEIMEDKERRQRLSNAAYVTVKEYADIKKNGAAFSDNLKKICANSQRRFWMNMIPYRTLCGLYRIHRKIKLGLQVKHV